MDPNKTIYFNKLKNLIIHLYQKMLKSADNIKNSSLENEKNKRKSLLFSNKIQIRNIIIIFILL